MNRRTLIASTRLIATLAGGLPLIGFTQPAAPPPALAPAGQALESKYAAQLKALQAELAAVIPALDEAQKKTFMQSRDAVKAAETAANTAQQALNAIGGAKGLVDHAKGKWIGGAEKGIAAAEAALKKATTDAEKAAAQKDLAHWQANKADGIKALQERQAAYEKAKVDEPKFTQANQAAKAALSTARTNEVTAAKAMLGKADAFLSSDKLDAKLVTCTVLINATPRGLAEFAQQGPAQESLVSSLLADPGLMKAMLEAGGPEQGKYGQAMQVLASIRKASPKAASGVYQRLALATSLEHAVPVKQANPAAATGAPEFVDPVQRYLHFQQAHLAGELDPAFKDLNAWELRNVVNGDETEESLVWGRQMLRNYRPDHVLNPDMGWRYSRSVTTDVKYGSQNVKDDLPELQPYQNIIKNGGVCGRRAFFGRFILRAHGIPTAARPQRGHAALVRWTPKGWVVNLGAGWGNPDAKGIMELTDADFLLESQIRAFPTAHLKALRAQWAGLALGEPAYISMKPNTGGPWGLLSQFAKKIAVAEAKPTQLAALGQNLGEANESAEVRARALVQAVVTDADKKITVAPSGVITVPAAACSGAQVLGSFLGGHQLFSGGGVISFDVEVPSAGSYALTARVTTVQDNPKVLISVNQAKDVAEMPVPYTKGLWQPTAPVRVSLNKGKNTVRLTRTEGSRGLSIKEFTLTPVK